MKIEGTIRLSSLHNLFFFMLFFLVGSIVHAQQNTPAKSEQNGYVVPFKIFDNIYYVGDKWVAAYLFASDGGLILVDTLEYPYSMWIEDNLSTLGFEIAEVNTIIITHGHSDHVSGLGWLQRKTNARIVMSADALTLTKRYFKNNPKTPQINNENIHQVITGERISSKALSLRIHETPGHTKGAISIEFLFRRNGNIHKGLLFGGVGTNFTGSRREQRILAQLYLKSVATLAELHQRNPFDIHLTNHPHRGKLFEKIQQSQDSLDSMIDHKGFSRFLQQLTNAGELKLRELSFKKETYKQQ